ncbi:putative major facilitator superfamily transporter [Colletotrichum sublineola]|uniref:Putative major facilitator superfamily transporter n=1 Tax=Colletotrichum sublineola TaxID=1173701 RepID=A0A066X7G4_COLSU|nr:putative major facilitator superfamily transporter [Colletotrichum sublineola]
MSGRVENRPLSSDLSGSIYLITANGQTLKLPMPSNSPYDPLGWSLPKRILAMAVLILYSIIAIMETQAASLMYPSLTAEFNGKVMSAPRSTRGQLSEPADVFRPKPDRPLPDRHTRFNAEYPLFRPRGLPVDSSFGGHRQTAGLLACVVLPNSRQYPSVESFGVLPASQSSNFAGVFGRNSPQRGMASQSLLIVIDLTFIDERPYALGMFWSLGATGGLLCSKSIPALAASGWRNFYSAWLFPCLAVLVCVFFFLPETYFIRPAVAFDGRILVQSGSEKIQLYDDWEQTVYGKPDNAAQSEPAPETLWQSIVRRWGVRKSGAGFREMWTCYMQTMLCVCNPLVFWVAILNALNFGALLLIGETYAAVMAEPPYSLPERVISLVNPVSAIGSLLAWPVSAILTSRVARRLTLRNGGVRDAEHYLVAFLPPVLAGAGSVILYGLTVQQKWNFIWIFVAYVVNAFSSAAFGIASTLWVTEAFPHWAAPAMVIVGGAGYMLSFATSSAVTPWLKSQGYMGASLEYGGVLLLVGAVAVPLAFCGKRLRQYIHGRWGLSQAGALRPQ